MPSITIHNADNLDVLEQLAAAGERFDLVELDGPYGANLEGWDKLSDDEYLAHYAARLSLVRKVLQPWGVVYLFGYPEGCAEIKTWTRQTQTLQLRRWITWHKQRTAHKGRKVEAILFFVQSRENDLWAEWKSELRDRRLAMGLNITEAMRLTPSRKSLAGRGCGRHWFESRSAEPPTWAEYVEVKNLFSTSDRFDNMLIQTRYANITDLDILAQSYAENTKSLNDEGLRSKPIGLYLDLFRPVVSSSETKRALILYGGSGNAALAAGKLGFDVTVVEQELQRCETIRRAWAWRIERRDETPIDELGPLFAAA